MSQIISQDIGPVTVQEQELVLGLRDRAAKDAILQLDIARTNESRVVHETAERHILTLKKAEHILEDNLAREQRNAKRRERRASNMASQNKKRLRGYSR